MVVGARVEHSKHGLGVVQHIFGAELDPKHVKVKVAFDNGQTHELKGAALEKLLVGGELSVTNPNPNPNPNPDPDPNPNPNPNQASLASSRRTKHGTPRSWSRWISAAARVVSRRRPTWPPSSSSRSSSWCAPRLTRSLTLTLTLA